MHFNTEGYLYLRYHFTQLLNCGVELITDTSVSQNRFATCFEDIILNPNTMRTKKFFSLIAIFYLSAKCCLLAQYISTVAGNGIAGYSLDDILATNSELNHPRSIDVDSYGNMYIADTEGHRIRKVNALTGLITTIAGNGDPGYSDDMLAVNALVDYPTDVAVDLFGNIYISDNLNHRIRRITFDTGFISTVAGTGVAGYSGDEGQATEAMLNGPQAIAIDADGNLYIADDLNGRIRKVTIATGIITTVAGGGGGGDMNGIPAIDATILNPRGVAIDGDGNIYFSQVTNAQIRMVSIVSGLVNTVAGTGIAGFSGDGGLAINAQISEPLGLVVDTDNNIYFADKNNNRIRKINAIDQIINTISGTGSLTYNGDGILAVDANINNATNVEIDQMGCVIIAEFGASRIRKISCDIISIAGCTYPLASNYNPLATEDDGSCNFPGCTDPIAFNFNPIANLSDGSCTYEACPEVTCQADFDGNGMVSVSDLLFFLGEYGSVCP